MNVFLDQYENHRDATESLLTLCVIDRSVASVLLFAEEQLKKAQKIANSVRRKKVNDALFGWISALRAEDPDRILNRLVFMNEGWIDLTADQIQTARQYKMLNPYYRTSEQYECAHFRDFFLNKEFECFVRLDKSKMYIYEWTRTKEQSSTKDVKNLETHCQELRLKHKTVYVQGVSETLPSSSVMVSLDAPITHRQQFFEWKERREMQEHHALLEQRLEAIKNPKTNLDLYVFGKMRPTIVPAIEAYELKELFIDEAKMDRLRQLAPPEALNFRLVPIRVLEKGDVGDRFLTEYNGLMGLRYFA
uniref:Uncharacterized protein n=1 Tax=viral metagenome TaxID=1070528 RepID=A0A6C0K4I7_9ZZZZ